MDTKRQFIPEVGIRCHLADWEVYRQYAPDFAMWSWFQVLSVDADLDRITLQYYTANRLEGIPFDVPLNAISTPIGWRERYTIEVKPDQVATVLSWFPRGITVRQSHYMPSCETAFQPSDNDDTPNWKFAGNTVVERIPPELCNRLVRVVKVETEFDVGIPAPCIYCVAGKRVQAANQHLTESTLTCPDCHAALGFSYAKPYHIQEHNCQATYQPATCWVCNGDGLGVKYLNELSRKERSKAIHAMHADGWKVSYDRHIRSWMRTRETVIKDWDTGVMVNA